MENNAPKLLINGSSALMTVTGMKAKARGLSVSHFNGSRKDLIDTVSDVRPSVLLTEISPSFSDEQDSPAAGFIDELCRLFPDTIIIAAICTSVRSFIAKFSPNRNLRFVVMPVSAERLAAIASDHAIRSMGGGVQPDIADHLREIGFSEKLSGFVTVCTAVEMCIREPWRLHDLMNAVYGDAGKRSGVDSRTAERLIRFMSLDIHKKGLSPCLSRGETSQKLTNNELIRALCDSFTAHMKAYGAGDDAIRALP